MFFIVFIALDVLLDGSGYSLFDSRRERETRQSVKFCKRQTHGLTDMVLDGRRRSYLVLQIFLYVLLGLSKEDEDLTLPSSHLLKNIGADVDRIPLDELVDVGSREA